MFKKASLEVVCNKCGNVENFIRIEFEEGEETNGRKFKRKLIPNGWQIITTKNDILIYCPNCLRNKKLKKIVDGI